MTREEAQDADAWAQRFRLEIDGIPGGADPVWQPPVDSLPGNPAVGVDASEKPMTATMVKAMLDARYRGLGIAQALEPVKQALIEGSATLLVQAELMADREKDGKFCDKRLSGHDCTVRSKRCFGCPEGRA